ncbi:hypothetical protein MO973_25080 [Paenibacillus sp. TRM 82003]|nr:hypothetical protein [Paenibacillus sp. TRM 82003]
MMLKKLEGNQAELFKTWIHDHEDTIVDIEGKHYLIKPLTNAVQEEIESDSELKELIRKAKIDIANHEVFTTEEVIEAIEKGRI